MTKKSRYFLAGSAVVLLVGLGAGTAAYLVYHRTSGVPAGLPAELRYVPIDAQLVAYADVKSVMASEMRRELERMTTGRRGQQQMHEFAGIDLEKDVNRVIAFMQAEPNAPAGDSNRPPRLLLLAQGTFDQAKVEQFMKDHGGVIEDYHGKHLVIRREPPAPPKAPDAPMPPTAPKPPSAGQAAPAPQAQSAPEIQSQVSEMRRAAPEMAIGFVQPDLIAVGVTELVRQALDVSTTTPNITTSTDVMALIRDETTANAWVVGQFDAVSRRMGLPPAVRTQVPPLRLVSASAHIDGGVKATVKAQTADEAAANQLRDVVRGAISFARLQTGLSADLQTALKTLELGGTGNSVQLSFVLTPDMLKAISPAPRPPSAPSPPSAPK
jgi:hypothetical protein